MQGDFNLINDSPCTRNITEDKNCPPLEILYFLRYNESNCSMVEECEKDWPCDVRKFFIEIKVLIGIVRILFEYGSIALVIIGLVVNIYSIFVLSSPPIKNSSISIYLKALAISDIGALIFNVTVSVLRARITIINKFYTDHYVMCILHRILSVVFFYFSTWLVVTFTIERMLMVKYPFRVQKCHSRIQVKVTVAIVATIAFCLAAVKATFSGFEKDNMYGYKPCGEDDHLVNIGIVPFVLVNLVLPIILITITNIKLLISVRHSAQNHMKLKGTFTIATSDDQAHKMQITRMVVIISIVYMLFYLPLGIIALNDVVEKQLKPTHSDEQLFIDWKKKQLFLKYLRSLCFFIHLITYVNNFFLYCLSGAIFRKTIKVCIPTYLQKMCPCIKVTKPYIIRQLTRSTQIYQNSQSKNLSLKKEHSTGVGKYYSNTAYIND